MARTVAIGIQDFAQMIEENCFYVDKTHFIKEWWESKDSVTLITRPRRFGKTLTMSMLEYSFSINYSGKKIYLRSLRSGKNRNTATCRGRILSSAFPLQP